MQAQNLSLQKAQEKREKRGVNIAVSGDSIRRISKLQYKVKSQTGNGWYRVAKTEDADVWACTCPDFRTGWNKIKDRPALWQQSANL